MRTTFPSITKFYETRLALEANIRNNPCSPTPGERMALLQEPFEAFDLAARTKVSNTNFDLQFFGWMIGLAFFTIFLFGQVQNYEWQDDIFKIVFWISIAVVSSIFLFVQSIFATRRILKREFYTHIASTLRPLKPNKEELQRMLGRSKEFELACRITAEQLHDLIYKSKP
jgi:hypothetical protein